MTALPIPAPSAAPPRALPADERVRRLVAAYDALDASGSRLSALLALYAEDARFADPFNRVQGRAAIARIFEHMHTQVRAPRFVVTEAACQGDLAWLRWDFVFDAGGRGGTRRIDGVSRIAFDARGQVADHLDFWDPAAQLYESVPVLGALLRAIRRRLAAPQTPQ